MKTSRSLWQYYKNVSSNPITDCEPFKPKTRIKDSTPADVNV